MTAPLRPTASHSRYETLDGLRGIAAISVMLFHFTQYCRPRPIYNAPLAVDLFFMLSGFVIAHSYGRRLYGDISPGEYVARRLIRLYPTFILGIVLGVIVLWRMQVMGMAALPTASLAASTLANILFLPFYNGISIEGIGSSSPTVAKIFPGNPPAWSLFFEVIASLGFLGLVRLKRPTLVATAATSLVLFLVCAFLTSRADHRVGFDMDLGWGSQNFVGGFPRVIFGFTSGMLIYCLSTDSTFTPFQSVRTFATRYVSSSWFLYVALVIVFLFPNSLRGFYALCVLVAIAPALLYMGSLVPCNTPSSLSAARFLGWISYPLYCLHFPVGRAVFMFAAREHIPNYVALLISILLSFAIAALLTKICEEPVRALLSRKLAQLLPSNRTAPTIAPTS